MKLLLGLFLALFMVAAPAQTLSVRNALGGRIVLTQERPCAPNLPRLVDGRVAFSYVDGKPLLRGCWRIADGAVALLWEDGDLLSYPLHWFTGDKET